MGAALLEAWQSRPLEAIYPIVYIDALVVKVRDGARVRNKAHIVVGVDLDGIKYVLGIWVSASEGAKFWAGVCAEPANRDVTDLPDRLRRPCRSACRRRSRRPSPARRCRPAWCT